MNSKEIIAKAQEEIDIEEARVAISDMKYKMKQLHSAKQVVKNLEREVRDLEEEINVRFSDIQSDN